MVLMRMLNCVYGGNVVRVGGNARTIQSAFAKKTYVMNTKNAWMVQMNTLTSAANVLENSNVLKSNIVFLILQYVMDLLIVRMAVMN